MAGNIYLIREGGGLLPMSEQPYDSEAMLQRLLAEHPALLAGEQMIDGSPRRWLLISRELPLSTEDGGASWYVDHLYLDQDGIPTLIEVKRSTDTRIRREVVGQMLDYAANAVVRWSVDQLRIRFDSEPDAGKRLQEFISGDNPEEFWSMVGANLAAGRIRMVFVADVIPPELRRVVDFLAAQLRNAEVFAVEVRNYQGMGERALVPRLVSTPKSTAALSGDRQWDERSFFEELGRRKPESVEIARSIMAWGRRNMSDIWYGKGTTAGSCIPRLAVSNTHILLFALWTYGTIEMQFQHLRVPPFLEGSFRSEFIEKLNQIPGVLIPEDSGKRRPSFNMTVLSAEPQRIQFLDAMQWAIYQINLYQATAI